MNLKQLRAFREVMLTGSISEAARNLYRTQPAISSSIANLEEDLECELFSRRGGRLHPVPEAHYLFEESSELLNRLDTVERNMKSLRDLEQGEIRLVSMPGPSVFMLPAVISRFVEGRNDVKVTLTTRSSPQVQHLLSTQQYDVGLADMGSMTGTDLNLVNSEAFDFECLCAMRADDPLASKPVVTPQDLDGKPMGTLYEDHPIAVQLQEAFAEIDAYLNIRIRTQYFIPLFAGIWLAILITVGLAFAAPRLGLGIGEA